MKHIATILHLHFLLLALWASAQPANPRFDSVCIDYRNTIENRYYKYSVIHNTISVKAEIHSTSRFVEDSASRRLSWVNEVCTRFYEVGRSDIVDNLTTMLYALYDKGRITPIKCDSPFVETDKPIVDFIFYFGGESHTLRFIEEPNCEYDESIHVLMNMLASLQDYPDSIHR